MDEKERIDALRKLTTDRREAEAEWDTAHLVQAPYAARFSGATHRLEQLLPKPRVTKAERLAAYDDRLHAGHAWYPHKRRLKEAERWLDAIDKEIKALEKKNDKKPRRKMANGNPYPTLLDPDW